MSAPPQALLPVLQALAAALSPLQAERDASLHQLQQWAVVPGYYASLVQIFSDKQLELGPTRAQIRLQAALQFKNGVDKFWRKSAQHAISVEEKNMIKPALLNSVEEPDRKLANTIALSIAKIARLDYGTDWEALPGTLLASLEQGLAMQDTTRARLILHRTLLYIHQMIKSLSSNRMPKGRAIMAQVTAIFFPMLRQLHEQMLEATVTKLQRDGLAAQEQEIEEIELALLSFKSLWKLVLYGYKDPQKEEAARSFWQAGLAKVATLVQLRVSLLAGRPVEVPNRTLLSLTKQTISIGKLYLKLFKQDQNAFLQMGSNQQIVETYWSVVEGASHNVVEDIQSSFTCLYPERFVVQSMLLLRSAMSSLAHGQDVQFAPEFILRYTELLVTKLLPLRPEDLERWTEDPEEWMNEEEAERWEFELRPCAEHVLKMLLAEHGQLIMPSLAAMLQQSSSFIDMQGLLLKEAVYFAVGQDPNFLPHGLDFGAWLDGSLVPEAAGTDSNQRIIRRRIAWLVGNYIDADLKPAERTKVYSLLTHLMGRNESTDTAIRLTAARSLVKCDTWDFDKEAFLPYLPNVIEQVVQLLDEVEMADTRKRLNETLGVVIDRVGENIMPFAPQLAEVLYTMWTTAAEPHFQTSVLVTMAKLVEALGDQSQLLQSQCAPIIQYSVNPSQPAHVYLQEDALELWLALLKRSSTLVNEMVALLPTLASLIAAATDVLPRCLCIFESYLLLDAAVVLHVCAVDLAVAFETILGDIKLDALKKILHAVDTTLQLAPATSWANAFDQSNTFIKVLQPVITEQAEGQALVVSRCKSRYLATVSRFVLVGADVFLHLVDSASSKTGLSSEDILTRLIIVYSDRLDNMTKASHRKLAALALAHLVRSSRPAILSRLPEIVSLWTSVLSETQETEDGDAEVYHDLQDYESDIEADFELTLESKRRADLSSQNPVHSMKLGTVITQQLELAQSIVGPEVFEREWLARVDPLVVDELMRRLQGKLAG
ncbi:hypothetical protein OIV83_000501 [Microbotryomycetes sp. JL201]|nr:hypothetical protein OIV83_000501 [Microbotryomycetes sp. JL201]